MRKLYRTYRASSRHWVGDGFFVQPLFSHMGDDRGTDPFLMLDYAAPHDYSPNNAAPRGVGQHPHKGFETVTIAYHGEVAHRDSTGGGGIIREGDVQWMTAGAGIVHEEFHSEAFSRRGGTFEVVQLWVNLPKKYKNTPPRYQHLPKENIPTVRLPENAGQVRLIAGDYDGTRGAADTFSELNVWDIDLNPNQRVTFRLPECHQLSMVILRGTVTFNEKDAVHAGELAVFENAEGSVQVQADATPTKILLLSGVPLREPVVGYGPFVMNTHEEIRQALNDYRDGRFGVI